MTTEIAAPPFKLDVRVARSPLTGLRYGIDGRATDIEEVVKKLEAAYVETEAAREEVTTRLRPYDASRRAIFERLTRRSSPELFARLQESLDLATELSRIDERLAGLRERIDGLRSQRNTLREVTVSLEGIGHLHEASIDSAGAAENQAVRQLFHLISVDHDSTAQEILEGPMQMLADAALHTELVGRVAKGDPAGAAEGAATCRRSADAALRALHRVVFAIHPDDLRDVGLIAPTRRLHAGVGAGATGRLLVLGSPRRLRHGVEIAIFRIIQEAVSNAVGHGHATDVEVVLLFQPTRVSVLVRDDGEGFDVPATEARLGRGTGLGLITMRQRAQIEEGHLEVRSIVGDGTEVRVSFDSPD